MPMPIFSTEEPSEIIVELVMSSGSQMVVCEHCGRVHYDETGEYTEEDELKKTKAEANAKPEKYIAHDGDVHWGHVMGKATVIDCPCNFLTIFEGMIWNNREIVLEYLKLRVNSVLSEATKTAQSIASARSAVAKLN